MSGETILIVEDNAALRVGICEMLILEGYEVLEARHGLHAMEVLRGATPDLILSDVMMPEMNGFDLYTQVRSQPNLISIPFIFLTARTDPADFLLGRSLGVDDYLTKPVTREELLTAIRSRIMRYSQVKLTHLQQAYIASLSILANAIEARVPGVHGHIEWLVELAQILAGYLDWSERLITQLRFGTILHDIGKLNVPENILFKTGPLLQREWLEIKSHPVVGAEMVRGVSFLADVAPLIRHHHERWDGTGYPDGLSAEAIPPGARILAVIDAFDAMVIPHHYAPPNTLEDAYNEILRCSGTQFDPQIVACFSKAWEAGRIQALVKNLPISEIATIHQPPPTDVTRE